MAVIEEKFTVYEKMMDKVESAIHTISELNQNISRMLSVHEEKIDNNIKTDDIIFEKLKKIEQKNTEEHQRVIEKLEEYQKEMEESIKTEKDRVDKEIRPVKDKLQDILRFRWVFVGGLAVVVFIATNPHIIIDVLTPNQPNVNIEQVK